MVKDELGNTYGRLLVQSLSTSKNGKAVWNCVCVCGKTVLVTGDSLRTGKVRSCGCFQNEWRKSGNISRTHGMSKSPTYKSWQEMWARCTSASHISFSNYGGRGIRVVTRWKSFELFLEDMGVRPNGTSIDRINNDGNYTPRNCKWATRVEQNNKRRQCRYITYARKTQTIAQWCTELSLPYPRTYNRLVVQNMTPKQAFETPYIPHKNRNWSHT